MTERLLKPILALLALALAGVLFWAGAGTRAPLIGDSLPPTGVGNPVTAVLLNFRGLDTLLEVTVLLLAFVCVLSLAPRHRTAQRAAAPPRVSPLLDWFVPRLLPLILLLGLALLWKGASYPGGAFQAATVLAGGGVLLALVRRNPVVLGARLRLALVAGPLAFLALSLGLAAVSGYFMQYPPALTKPLVLAAEIAFTLSIAFSLFMLVVGLPAEPGEGT